MVFLAGLGPGGLEFESGPSNNPFHKGILGIQTTGTQTNNLSLVWLKPLKPTTRMGRLPYKWSYR